MQDDSQERTEQYEKYGKGEKHMKKYICRLAVILTLALLVCLIPGCGKEGEEKKGYTDSCIP